jgi:lipid II:glycine glycyltransferase (peptidoglycan interpeptide bridge formation enzyme)
MELIEIKNKEEWNQFVIQNGSQFLQSWEWGEFQRSLGKKIWILAVKEEEKILAGALIIKYDLPLGKSYLYLPRGPIIDLRVKIEDLRIGCNSLFDKIVNIAKEKKAIFVRIEPTIKDISTFNLKSLILNLAKPVQPKEEWRLNLTPNEENLLKTMHPKTRYNINLAIKHGVKIREGDKEKDFDKFWQLIAETFGKKGLKTHPQNYYREIFNLEPVKLYLAEYQDKVLAANMMVFWGDQVYYLHGGSSVENKNVMAPYLMFWETIKIAKALGYKYYNFGGIAPTESGDKHPWFGITRFKKGFGGEEIGYTGTFDLPINKIWYNIYKFGKLIFR